MLENSPPVFQYECDEPTGKHIRVVRQLIFDEENLEVLWEKVNQFPILFGEEIQGDRKVFMDKLMNITPNGIELRGLYWVIDDFLGIYYLTNITFGPNNIPEDALVHYSFFDKRHHGREGMTKEFTKYVFNKYQFNRLTAHVPMYATPQTFEFVERHVGFKYEGRKRKCCHYKGEWFDMKIYGLLKSEVI